MSLRAELELAVRTDAADDLDEVAEGLEDVQKAADDTSDSIDDFGKSTKKAGKSTSDAVDDVEDLGDSFGEVEGSAQDGADSMEEFGDTTKDAAKDAGDEVEDMADTVSDGMGDAEDSVEDFSDTTTQGFGDVADSGGDVEQTFEDVEDSTTSSMDASGQSIDGFADATETGFTEVAGSGTEVEGAFQSVADTTSSTMEGSGASVIGFSDTAQTGFADAVTGTDEVSTAFTAVQDTADSTMTNSGQSVADFAGVSDTEMGNVVSSTDGVGEAFSAIEEDADSSLSNAESSITDFSGTSTEEMDNVVQSTEGVGESFTGIETDSDSALAGAATNITEFSGTAETEMQDVSAINDAVSGTFDQINTGSDTALSGAESNITGFASTVDSEMSTVEGINTDVSGSFAQIDTDSDTSLTNAAGNISGFSSTAQTDLDTVVISAGDTAGSFTELEGSVSESTDTAGASVTTFAGEAASDLSTIGDETVQVGSDFTDMSGDVSFATDDAGVSVSTFTTVATEDLGDAGGAAGGMAGAFTDAAGNVGNAMDDADISVGTFVTDAGNSLEDVQTDADETGGQFEDTSIEIGDSMSDSGIAVDDFVYSAESGFGDVSTQLSTTQSDASSFGPNFDAALQPAETATDDLNTKVNTLSSTITNNFNGALGSMNRPVTIINDNLVGYATTTNTANTNTGVLAGTVKTVAGNMGIAAASAISLWGAFDNVRDASNRVHYAQVAVDKANWRLVNAQKALNKLLDSGTASTLELSQAQEKVRLAQEAVGKATVNLANTQENYNKQLLYGVTTVVPAATGSAAASIAVYKDLKKAVEGSAMGAAGLASAMTTVGVAIAGATAIITAGIAAFTAWRTNAGGFRDRLDEIRKGMDQFFGMSPEARAFWNDMEQGLGDWMDSALKSIPIISDIYNYFTSLWGAKEEDTQATEGNTQATDENTSAQERGAAALDDYNKTLDAQIKAAQDHIFALTGSADAYEIEGETAILASNAIDNNRAKTRALDQAKLDLLYTIYDEGEANAIAKQGWESIDLAINDAALRSKGYIRIAGEVVSITQANSEAMKNLGMDYQKDADMLGIYTKQLNLPIPALEGNIKQNALLSRAIVEGIGNKNKDADAARVQAAGIAFANGKIDEGIAIIYMSDDAFKQYLATHEDVNEEIKKTPTFVDKITEAWANDAAALDEVIKQSGAELDVSRLSNEQRSILYNAIEGVAKVRYEDSDATKAEAVQIALLNGKYDEAVALLGGTTQAAQAYIDSHEDTAKVVEQSTGVIGQWSKSITEQAQRARDLANTLGIELNPELEKNDIAMASVAAAGDEIEQTLIGDAIAARGHALALNEMHGSLVSTDKILAMTKEEAEAFSAALEEQDKTLESNKQLLDEINPSLKETALGLKLVTDGAYAVSDEGKRMAKMFSDLDSQWDSSIETARELARVNGVDVVDAYRMTDDQIINTISSFENLNAEQETIADTAQRQAQEFADHWIKAMDDIGEKQVAWGETMNTAADKVFEQMGETIDKEGSVVKAKFKSALGFDQQFWEEIFPEEIMRAVWDENMDWDSLISGARGKIDEAVGEGLITRERARRSFDPLFDFLDTLPGSAAEKMGLLIGAGQDVMERFRSTMVEGLEITPDIKQAIGTGIIDPIINELKSGKISQEAGPALVNEVKNMIAQLEATGDSNAIAVANMLKASIYDPMNNMAERDMPDAVGRLINTLDMIVPGFKEMVTGIDSDTDQIANIFDTNIMTPAEQMRLNLLENLRDTGYVLGTWTAENERRFRNLATAIAGVPPPIDEVSRSVGIVNQATAAGAGSFTAYRDGVAGIGTAASNAGTPLSQAAQHLIDVNTAAGNASGTVSEFSKNTKGVIQPTNDAASSTAGWYDIIAKFAPVLGSTASFIVSWRAGIETQFSTWKLNDIIAASFNGMTQAIAPGLGKTASFIASWISGVNTQFSSWQIPATAWTNHANAVRAAITGPVAGAINQYRGLVTGFLNQLSSTTTRMTTLWTGHGTATRSAISSQIGGAMNQYRSLANSMQSQLSSITTRMTNLWNTHARGTQSATNQVRNAVSQMVSSASSSLSRLSSSTRSSMNNMVSSMNNGISAARRLQSAINSLRGRTITVTTVYRTVGRPGAGVRAQHGFGGLVDQPTKMLVGEAGPELVSVIPLSRKNTGATAGNVGLGGMVRLAQGTTRPNYIEEDEAGHWANYYGWIMKAYDQFSGGAIKMGLMPGRNAKTIYEDTAEGYFQSQRYRVTAFDALTSGGLNIAGRPFKAGEKIDPRYPAPPAGAVLKSQLPPGTIIHTPPRTPTATTTTGGGGAGTGGGGGGGTELAGNYPMVRGPTLATNTGAATGGGRTGVTGGTLGRPIEVTIQLTCNLNGKVVAQEVRKQLLDGISGFV